MRIIAGVLGGRTFDSPHTGRTHPMSDKMRGALFNILGEIDGLTVLDPFAGTGALSFEAISRGAKHATAIDSDKNAQRVIEKNIVELGLKRGEWVKLIKNSANAWLQTAGDPVFDLVLCDPPYNDLQVGLLERLCGRVETGGLMVLSWPGDTEPVAFSDMELIEQRSYGDAQLVFYRKIS